MAQTLASQFLARGAEKNERLESFDIWRRRTVTELVWGNTRRTRTRGRND